MNANSTCRACGTELNDENWYPSQMKKNERICKECNEERQGLWRKANPDKAKAIQTRWRESNPEKTKARCTRSRRKHGTRPFNENKECSSFLGVHVAERVLSHVFKDVERMPYGHSGYDFVCNKGKKIDVKSSCQRKNGQWGFTIRHNTTADFFLCLAFDNREDLTPLHAWLLPGIKFNHLTGTTILPNTINKWDEYRLDISKVNNCCNEMR